MLYQLSYALKPHYQLSTFSQWNFAAKQRRCNLLQATLFTGRRRSREGQLAQKSHVGRGDRRWFSSVARNRQPQAQTFHLGSARWLLFPEGNMRLSPVFVARSHLSRTTVSLTWGTTHSSLRLLHDNGCKHVILNWQRTGAVQVKPTR
jgi:hypothetical protein